MLGGVPAADPSPTFRSRSGHLTDKNSKHDH
jgi:hypothetical protein